MKSIAIIGCGKKEAYVAGKKVGWAIGYAHAQGYRQAFPDARIYAVDPNQENLAEFLKHHELPPDHGFASTDALYKAVTPDAASICTWPGLHVPQAIEACHRKVKAVTVEKPLGLDGFQIRELSDVAQRMKTAVAVAHQRRYEPWFVMARDLIRQGVLGENLVVEARVGDQWDMLSWTVHWFDMANFLFDALAQSVMAGLDHTGERRYGHAVENASVVHVDYGPKRQALFVTGPAALPFFGVTVRGERGMMQVDPTIRLWTTDGYREIVVPSMEFSGAYASLFADLWNQRETGGCRCSLDQCAPATLMAYAAHESARTNRAVTLSSTPWFAPLEVLAHLPKKRWEPALSIALLADGHHEWSGCEMSGRLGLRDALESMGHRVTVLDATKDLEADALSGADVLMPYHTQQKTRDSHLDVVGKWMTQGRPVVVSHCGIGAYADWLQFRKWIGRYWVWGGETLPPSTHPHVSCDIRVDDPKRFAVPWESAWLPIDEMYQNLGQASAIVPLATAIAPNGNQEVYAWQVKDHPNVGVWLPGHRRDMFTLPVMRDGLSALLKLVAKR